MTNVMKEQAISCIEAYANSARNEAYDNVLNILHSRYTQLDNLLSSTESKNILIMSKVERFGSLCDKRRSLRLKIFQVLDILEQVSELRYGKY